MLVFILLCISICAISGQDPKVPTVLPDEFSASFISSTTNGETSKSEVFVGNIYFSKKLNKAAFIAHKSFLTEQYVFNYNTNQVLVINERIAKECKIYRINEVINQLNSLYNPTEMIQELTNQNLEYDNKTVSVSGISSNVWLRTESQNNNNQEIFVEYSELPWSFASKYPNVSRPLAIETIEETAEDNINFNGYYFMDITDSVPREAMMPSRGVICTAFDDSKQSPPSLPLSFRVDSEVHSKDGKFGVKSFYDSKAKVVREDVLREHEGREIHIKDKKYGIFYMFDNASVCTAQPFFALLDVPDLGVLQNEDMKNFKYIGNRTCSQGNCEVWSGYENGIEHNLYLKHTKQKVSDQMQNIYIPVQMISNWNGISQEEASTNRHYYFNFEPGFPSWSKFDVSSCYAERFKMRFQIVLKGNYLDIRSIPAFERNFQFAIFQKVGITEMRVHQLRVDNMLNDYVVVTLTLLEDPRRSGIKVANKISDLPRLIYSYSVYNTLSNSILKKQFIVATKGINGSEILFYGDSINKNLMSEQKIEEKGASLAKFKPKHRRAFSISTGDSQINGLTVDSCASLCDYERTSQCNMFMFCKDTQACVISESLIDDRIDEIHTSSNCDVYSRDFAYDYKLYRGIRLLTEATTDWTVKDESLGKCFADCFKKNDSTPCHSVEYCTDGNSHVCVFHAKHYSQRPRIISDRTCLHYSQQFMRMYRAIPDKSIKDAADKYISIQYDITATECAQNCFLDPAGCTNFEMCKLYPGAGLKSVCHILEPKTTSINQENLQFVKNVNCDHYRLKGPKTDFKLGNSTDVSGTAEPVGMSNKGGYNPGDMAKLAVAMLLFAGFAGAGAVYLYIKRQQRRGNSDFVMKFVRFE